MVKSIKKNIRLIPLSLTIIGLILLLIGAIIAWNTLSDINLLDNHNPELKKSSSTIFQLLLIIVLETVLLILFILWIRRNTAEVLLEDVTVTTESELEKESKELNDKGLKIERLEAIFDDLIEKVNELNVLNLDLDDYCNELLQVIAKKFEVSQGIIYTSKEIDGQEKLIYSGGYAYFKENKVSYGFGEGLAGQVAKAQRVVNIRNIPEGYIKIVSGLGEATPTNLLVCPIIQEIEGTEGKTTNTLGVLELASFKEFSKREEKFFKELLELVTYKLDVLLN